MKKLLSLILSTLLLVSCTKTVPGNADTAIPGSADPADFNDIPRLDRSERIDLPDLTGYVPTTLEKITDLAPYKTSKQVDSYVANPQVTSAGGTVYLLRNFPADLPDGPGTWDAWVGSEERDVFRRVIEVYRDIGDLSEPEIIPLDERIASSILYELNANPDGTFSAVGRMQIDNGPYAEHLLHIAADGSLIAMGQVSYGMDDRIRPYGDSLLRLPATNNKFSPAKLTRIYLDGSIVTLAENVINFSLQDSTVYYLTEELDENFEEIRRLHALDLVTGETAELSEVILVQKKEFMQPDIRTMAYDPDNRVLYLTEFQAVDAFLLDTKETVPVVQENEYCSIVDMDGSSLFMEVGNHQVTVYGAPSEPYSAEADTVTLRLASYYPADVPEKLLLSMDADGYPVRTEYIFGEDPVGMDEYANTMAKKLMAGDADFDLFYVSTETPELFKDGYYTDLGGYALLHTYFSRMPDGVRELCSVGTRTVLCPDSLTSSSLAIDRTAAGDSFTAPATFTQFCAYADSLTLPDNMNLMPSALVHNRIEPWMTQLLSNYMAGNADEAAALTHMTALFDWAISQHAASDPAKPDSAIRPVTGHANADMIRFPTPKLDETFLTPYSGGFWAVNPNSENRELAALYLAYSLALDLTDGYRFADEGTDYTDGIREYPASAYMYDVYTLLEDCLAGKTTTADAASQLMKMVKMIKEE